MTELTKNEHYEPRYREHRLPELDDRQLAWLVAAWLRADRRVRPPSRWRVPFLVTTRPAPYVSGDSLTCSSTSSQIVPPPRT